MTIATGNIFSSVPSDAACEQLTALLAAPNLRLERIVSYAHASPEGFWYDQEWAEWVIVLQGAAGLLFEGEAAPRILGPGDHVQIPAHARHRVAWTAADQPTIWLALHYR